MQQQSNKLPTYYLSHGGGPWPFMHGPFRQIFSPLEQALQDIPRQLGCSPACILLVSSHWQTCPVTISAAEKPGMLYDYHGFPSAMYRISYPAAGSPDWAYQAAACLQQWDIHYQLDTSRGFDHAVYSLLKPMWPAAEVPVVMLSVHAAMSAALHYRLGQALAPLREKGVLILASGQSFHNLSAHGAECRLLSLLFDCWLRDAVLKKTGIARQRALEHWHQAPAAQFAHPTAEHLMPLFVAAGAAAHEQASCVFGDFLADAATSAFCFGDSRHAASLAFDRLAHDFHGERGLSGSNHNLTTKRGNSDEPM